MPMGPFRLNDLVGSDIGLHVGKNFVESFAERCAGAGAGCGAAGTGVEGWRVGSEGALSRCLRRRRLCTHSLCPKSWLKSNKLSHS